MSRIGAFTTHLGICLVIFALLGYLILFHWYPDFFFASDGGWQGIRIVAFVDLVLGPALTLVVFNPRKPRTELRRDLGVIALIQLSCLTAGTYVVYAERPIAMVYADGMFQSMTADDYQSAGEQVPDLADFPGDTPKWVSVVLPEDPEAQAKIRLEALRSGRPLKTMSAYYAPFDPSHIDPERDGLSADELRQRDERTPFLKEFLRKNGGKLDNFSFVPFGTRYALALIALNLGDSSLNYVEVPALGPTPR